MDNDMSDWIKHDIYTRGLPVDGEQQVEVRWKPDGHSDCNLTTTGRAGKFNWEHIAAYRILPNRPHAQ